MGADEDDAEEEARERREARLAARDGADARLTTSVVFLCVLAASVLYLATVPRGARWKQASADLRGSSRRWAPSLPFLLDAYDVTSSLLDVAALAIARLLYAAIAFSTVAPSDRSRARLHRARIAVAAISSSCLTAKGVARLPALSATTRDQCVFWAAWSLAFVAVPVEWAAASHAMAYADLKSRGRGSRRRRRRRRGDDDDDDDDATDLLLAADAGCHSDEENDAGGDDERKRRSKKKDKASTLGALLKLSYPDLPILSVAFAFLVLYAIAAASGAFYTLVPIRPLPHFTGCLVDAVAIDRDAAAFRRYSVSLLIAALLAGIFAGLRGSVFTVQMARLNARVRRRLFDAVLRQDVGFFDLNKTGDLSSRLNNDCSTVSNALSLNINVMLRNAVNVIGVLCFMLALSWPLTAVTLASLPPTVVVSKVYGRYFKRISKKTQKALAEATEVAEESLGSVKTIRAFAAEPHVSADFASRLQEFCRQNTIEARYVVGYTFCLTAMPMMVTVLVLWYGGMLVLRGMLNPGALVSFMLYQQQLTSCFSSIADVFTAVAVALGAAEKVLELIAKRPKFHAWPGPGPGPGGGFPSGDDGDDGEEIASARLVPERCVGRLALEMVCFSYPSRPDRRVLTDFNLAVNPGETVALVGPSGGGKSSVINLIERFYVPDSGVVRLDGRDLADLDPRWLKRRISLVSQEPTLFNRSLRRNIIFGLERAEKKKSARGGGARGGGETETETETDGGYVPLAGDDDDADADDEPSSEQIVAAAKAANAHEFIAALPGGYEEVVGERGSTLSGGQKQRVAIARALVRDPTVLLLDEATSALDAESEAIVQEALGRVMANYTVVVVAHRLSTIQNASRICVVDKGRIVESGTHRELLERGGAYENLVRHQLSAMSASAASLNSLDRDA